MTLATCFPVLVAAISYIGSRAHAVMKELTRSCPTIGRIGFGQSLIRASLVFHTQGRLIGHDLFQRI
jgi:hypothetical protein